MTSRGIIMTSRGIIMTSRGIIMTSPSCYVDFTGRKADAKEVQAEVCAAQC